MKSSFHRLSRSDTGGIRLCHVKIIRGNTVADYFRENGRAAFPSDIEIFQRQNRCALSEDHAGAISVEWAAFFCCRGLKRIKTDEDQFRECVIAAGQHALVTARSHTLIRMADRVRAGGAGIRDYLTGSGNSECFLRVNHRLLRGVIRDPGRRVPQIPISTE